MRKQLISKTARALRGGVKMACLGAAAMWLASCAGTSEMARYRPAPAPLMADSHAEGSAAKSAEKPKRAAEERPGLAMGFGESIRSDWVQQSFVRAMSSPSGRSLVYYNDREGLEAMSGGTERADAG